MKAETRQDIEKLIHDHELEIKNFGVRRIALFGSFARNEQKEDSDIDLLVEFEKDKKKYRNLSRLFFLIQSITGRTVDILTPDSINPLIEKYIMKELVYIEIS